MKNDLVKSWQWLIPLCFFLFAAPFWAPYAQVVKGSRTFLEADSMMLLGLALLTGWIFCLALPESLLRAVQSVGQNLRRQSRLILGLTLIAALFVIMAVNRFVLHSFMNSGDEHSCYFLAECFRMGRWWLKPHPLSEFFNVTHVGNRDGKWFSVYPYGWPLIFAVGLKYQIQDWLNPVLSVLSLVFLFKIGEKVFGRTVALFSVIFLVISPFFTFTSASYYSHSTCLLMMTVFGYAFLKWREAPDERNRIFWAAVLGLACGYGLATRYLTMAAFALPFIAVRGFEIWKKKERFRKSDLIFCVIVGLFMLSVLYQNYVVTGKPFKAPNRYDKSWERLGFRDFYTPIDALIYLIARCFYLMDWAPPLFLVWYFVSLFKKRKFTLPQKLFRYAYLYPVIAYIFYFSWGGNQYGPRYYYEAFPFLILAMTDGLRFWWSQNDPKMRKFLLGALIVSFGTAGYQYAKQGQFFEKASYQRKVFYEFAEKTIQEPAIVFIQGTLGQLLAMSQDDSIRNHPSLAAKILYAKDTEASNQKLMDYYPNRVAYRGHFDREVLEPKLEKISPTERNPTLP